MDLFTMCQPLRCHLPVMMTRDGQRRAQNREESWAGLTLKGIGARIEKNTHTYIYMRIHVVSESSFVVEFGWILENPGIFVFLVLVYTCIYVGSD